ncbi:DUF4123 domain-containing protein [Halomonas sp. G11]|uniref:DUF4123 domain-containing protein n=1 Tax=Halomonas sp. G11 TaxID=1684425 RepID=UPI0007FC2259|nr:DUF4123 domain-containing protein [Halomonas sp. G11]OBA00487.1 hypothetical protein ADS46_11035 [Halomonas sp. G11]
MSGWLNQLAERCYPADNPAGMVTGQRGFVVLDQRHSPEQGRPLLSLPGKRDFVTLFAGTPLSPLLEASPWLLDVEVGSEAWHYAEKLCQQRLGWVCQPPADQTLQSIADHLRELFVMDDPHGGKSLINLQQPAAWTALLASAPASVYSHGLNPLGQVATPTPQGQWSIWQAGATTSPAPQRWQLTADMEAALNESQQAWWLSRMTKTPLTSLPNAWLARMKTAMQAGISRSDHLKRLLPIMTDEGERLHIQIDDILNTPLPSRQKVQQLERLL